MPKIKVNKSKNQVVMSTYHFKDKNLSLKAKGLLSQMLSLPKDWDYTIAGLVKINKENESAIKSALEELKKYGYLIITKLMPSETKTGRIEYIYDIYEQPQDEKQEGDFLPLEILPLENQGQYNNSIINNTNNITNSNIINNKSNINITTKSPKHNLYSDCIDIINDFTGNDSLRDCLVQYLNVLLEINRKNGKQLYKNVFKGKLNALDKIVQENKYTDKETEEVVMLSVTNGWQNFYALRTLHNNRFVKDYNNTNIIWQTDNDTGGEIIDEQY